MSKYIYRRIKFIINYFMTLNAFSVIYINAMPYNTEIKGDITYQYQYQDH